MNIDKERLEAVLLGQQRVLDEVHGILAAEEDHDNLLRAVVKSAKGDKPQHVPGVDPARIFHINAIRAACMKYRLRFLDAALFKGELPGEAIVAIRSLERRSGSPLTSFKIMAPGERFRLCDSEVDPLLFVPIGGDRYYLVCKWGNDLKWYRALLGWPFRSAAHLAATVALLAVVMALALPNWLLTADPQASWMGMHRFLGLLWSGSVLASFTVFGWFAFFGQFSADAWNSRYFN
jgi:hypothetical protein